MLGLPISTQSFKETWAAIAFRSGLNLQISTNVQFLDLFTPSNTKALVNALHSNFPKTGDDIENALLWSWDLAYQPTSEDSSYRSRFQHVFKCWINQPGHIDAPEFATYLQINDLELFSNDLSLRPRMFLRTMTGQESFCTRVRKMEVSELNRNDMVLIWCLLTVAS